MYRAKIAGVILFVIVLLSSCAIGTAPQLAVREHGAPVLTVDEFREHVLMFDSLGRMRQPIANQSAPQELGPYPRLRTEDSDVYIDQIIRAIHKRRVAEG